MNSPFTGYLIAILFITTWWIAAFAPKIPQKNPVQSSINLSVPTQNDTLSTLSPLNRSDLIKALSGDIKTTARLIADWDLDAQLLQQKGIQGIQRLSKETLLSTLELAYQILQGTSESIDLLRRQTRSARIEDDLGKLFILNKNYDIVLPQTLAAASFILALKGTQGVAAIPKGMRHWQPYFPNLQMNDISLDCDRFHGEALSALKPQIAFVADFSNPATLEALKRQGLEIFTFNNLHTKEAISSAILRIGHVINRAPEAEILKTFLEAAFLCIDNRVAALKNDPTKDLHPLVLYYYSQWYFPSEKTLTSRLAKRAGIGTSSNNVFDTSYSLLWLQPISNEQIVFNNPNQLIIATDHQIPASLTYALQQHPLSEISACSNNALQIVDAELQQSVSQHIVLAYYELYLSLVGLKNSCPQKPQPSIFSSAY